MTPHLHPSEIRAPAPEKRAGRKRLRALQIGVAAAAVAASFAAAAYVVTQLPEEPAPKVTFNRIEDWPEIKNGVPALAPPKPAPTATLAPTMPEQAPLAAAPQQPAFAVRPPEAEAVAGLDLRGAPAAAEHANEERPSPAPEPPPIAASAPDVPVADEPAKAPEPATEAEMPTESAVAASAPASPAAAEATAPPVAPPAAKTGKAPSTRIASPRPTPPAKTATAKTAPAKTAKAKPRPAKVASAPPTEAPPAAPASPPAPPPEDDRVHVLGLSLPNLLPSGRKIREAVQSLGL
jgi:hypothetical protein